MMVIKIKSMAEKYGAELSYVLAGRLLAMVGAIFSLKLTATYLPVAEMALFGLAVAFANGSSRFLFSPLTQTVLRFTSPMFKRGELPELAQDIQRMYLKRMLLLFFFTIIASIVIRTSFLLITLSLVLALALGQNVISLGYFTAMRNRITMAGFQAGIAFGRGVFALPLLILYGATAESVLLGYIGALILAIIIQWWILSKNKQIDLRKQFFPSFRPKNKERHEQVTSYSNPFLFIMAIDLLVWEADKFIYSGLITIEMLGTFVAVQQLAKFVPLFIVGLVEQFLIPIFFSNKTNLKKQEISRRTIVKIVLAFGILVLPILLLSATLYPFSKPIIALFTSEKFIAGAELLPFLVAGYALSQSSRILQLSGLSQYESSQYILPKLLQAAVLYGGVLILLPEYGLISIGYSVLASSLALVLCLLFKCASVYLKATV